MIHLIADGESTLARRGILIGCVGAVAALAGCVLPERDSDERDGERLDDPGGTLSIEVTSDVPAPVSVEIGLVEAGASFDESVIASFRLGAAGDAARSRHDDVRGGPFRLVVRRVGANGRDEFETTWDLEECPEFGLAPTIRNDEIAVTTACTYPPGRTAP